MDLREKIAREIEPAAWAAMGTGDTLAYRNRRVSSERKADRILAIADIADALEQPRFPYVPPGDNAQWAAPDGTEWLHEGTTDTWHRANAPS